jgi:dTDP-4-dehydrorhamnose 3,5-epimerase
MRFIPLTLAGVYLIEPERREDERGFFARTWCQQEFEAHGLEPRLAQCSISYNRRAGTLRGMHLQTRPHEEVKVVRCTAGAIHDVLLDLRRESPTYLRWMAADLTADNRHALYVPAGIAHGFQTLTDHSEVFYQISEFYHPECASGVRWDDPLFGIPWPLPDPILSEKDKAYPDYLP